MNIFERIKLRQTIMLFQLLISKIMNMLKTYSPKPHVPAPEIDSKPSKPNKPRRPLKRIINTIDEELKNAK